MKRDLYLANPGTGPYRAVSGGTLAAFLGFKIAMLAGVGKRVAFCRFPTMPVRWGHALALSALFSTPVPPAEHPHRRPVHPSPDGIARVGDAFPEPAVGKRTVCGCAALGVRHVVLVAAVFPVRGRAQDMPIKPAHAAGTTVDVRARLLVAHAAASGSV